MKNYTLSKCSPINCHIYRDGRHVPELKPAWVMKQNMMPEYKFYITEVDMTINGITTKGYTLTEYSTGMNMGGYYPAKTKPDAAKWLQMRVDNYGTDKIKELIVKHINDNGPMNM